MTRGFGSLRLGLFLALALSAGLARADASAVGTVTLRLGEAWIVRADGERRPAQAGSPVHGGESLETAASGHLHVRFVDGGLVAVRPGSRLEVQEYRDPAARGAIRIRLERGVARSITGAWAEAERSRYRLNTPIAAIGISGTDFVVETDSHRTRVAVNSGAIVAAPFDELCRPEGLGPCAGERARQLGAGGFMLELKAGDHAPVLLPRKNGLAAVEDARRAAQAAAAPQEESVTETTVVKAVVERLPATLAWGRWAHAAPWPGESLVLSREEAAAGRERVAENSRYVLYRLPQAEPLPASGAVGLSLAGAQAHLVQPGALLPAEVLGGQLRLDFAARRFETSLSLRSAPTGEVPFAAQGQIAPDGTFGLIEWQNRVLGAFGRGGSGPSAAYLFERATPQGMFMGLTQWR